MVQEKLNERLNMLNDVNFLRSQQWSLFSILGTTYSEINLLPDQTGKEFYLCMHRRLQSKIKFSLSEYILTGANFEVLHNEITEHLKVCINQLNKSKTN